MPSRTAKPLVTIAVLTFGDYPQLAKRTLDSIRENCDRNRYRLVVGANAVCQDTQRFLQTLRRSGAIDRLILSPRNLGKCPMMRRMFTGIRTEFIWWFDDDSYVTRPGVLNEWLRHARPASTSTVMWGQMAECDHEASFTEREDVPDFVRQAKWYRGLPPPSWRPGGKGEFNFENRAVGDGRWFFILGGCWLIRTCTVRALDWPDHRLIRNDDDVFLGEAIRQNGWNLANIGTPGVALNTQPRR